MRSHRGKVFAGLAPSEAKPDQGVFQFGKEGEVFMLINIFSMWGGCALATANSLSAQLGDEVEIMCQYQNWQTRPTLTMIYEEVYGGFGSLQRFRLLTRDGRHSPGLPTGLNITLR